MSWESNRSATSTRMITTSMYIRLFDLTSLSSLVYPSIGCAASMLRNGHRRNFGEPPQGEVRKWHRTGPLARIEVFGLLHAVLERKAGKSLFRRVAAQPCPLFFGDPESGFYPHFPLGRPRVEVFRFLVEALRFHHLILAQGA